MPDVFISYSRRDSAFVGELADGLRSHGKEVWVDIDGLRDAEVFPVALRHAIEESDGFVFVISPAAVKSAYCAREIADAVDAGKRIVPVDLTHVAPDDLPEAIRVRNWIPVQDDMPGTIGRVARALETDLEHARAHTHWELKALEWEEKSHSRSLLLRGAELADAEAWVAQAETKDPPPTALQREFLGASNRAAAVRQRRIATISLAVAAVSVALLVFAVIQRSAADQARKTNKSRAVALASQTQAAVDPERALLLALAADDTRRTPDSLFALRNALDADPLLHRFRSFGIQNCVQPSPGVSFSPLGILAVGLCDGRIMLFDAGNRLIGSFRQPDAAAPLRFNPDGSQLATSGAGVIRLFQTAPPSGVKLLRVPGTPQRIVYSGDGRYLAATSSSIDRSWTSVWSAHTGHLTMQRRGPPPTSQLTPLVRGIGFVDGHRALAIGSPIGPVTVVSSVGGHVLRTLPDKEDALIGFDRAGRHLVVGGFHTHGSHSGEGVVTVWNTRTWRKPRVVATAARLRPRNIYVSPDASRVAVGWSDGSAGGYSVFTGASLARFLGPPQPVSALTFSPDSRRVAVGAADGSVRIWRAGGVERAYAETGSRLDYELPAVTDSAVTVASAPNLLRVYALPALKLVQTKRIPLPSNATYTNAFLSTLGNTAVMIRSDGRADVWSLRGMRRILTLSALPTALAAADDRGNRMILLDGTHNEIVNLLTHRGTPLAQRARNCRGQWRAALFSGDGKTAVAGASCGEVYVWDARSGKLGRRIVLPNQISA